MKPLTQTTERRSDSSFLFFFPFFYIHNLLTATETVRTPYCWSTLLFRCTTLVDQLRHQGVARVMELCEI